MADFHIWDEDKRITDVTDLTDDMLLAVALDPDGTPTLKAAAATLVGQRVASAAGMPRWLGPKRIYAVQNQTIAITSNPRAATGAITVDSLAGIQDGDTLTFTPTVGDAEVWTFRVAAPGAFEILISVVSEANQAVLIADALFNTPSALVFSDDSNIGPLVPVSSLQIGASGNNNPVISTTASGLSLAQLTGGNNGGDFTVGYTGGDVTEVSIVSSDIGFSVNDEVPLKAGRNDCVIKVLSIDGEGRILTLEVLTAGSGYQLGNAVGLGNESTIFNIDAVGAPLVRSDPINFNDNATAVQAALDAIPALTGHVTVTGDMPESHIALDDSITVPLLLVLGTNNLVDGAGAGAVYIFIKDADILTTLVTPADGDVISDVLVETIEGFSASPDAVVTADGKDHVLVTPGILEVAGQQCGGSRAATDTFPFRSAGGPVVLKITGAGGSGNTTGIADVWYEIATPS